MKKKWIYHGAWILGTLLVIYLISTQTNAKSTWGTWSLPLSGKIIVIDAGHGFPDGGAEAHDPENTQESEITLKISKILRDYLQEAGALVYMTRETENDLASPNTSGYSKRKAEDIRKRVDMIKEWDPNLYVSIHLNASTSPEWRGAQAFYYPGLENSEKLAKRIQSEIKRNLENTNRDIQATNGIYILKKPNIPGVLVEAGFLSNNHERELLKTGEYQDKVAASIYQGILRYVTEVESPKNED